MRRAHRGVIAWNRGLTKERDYRVRRIADGRNGRKFTALHRKHLSEAKLVLYADPKHHPRWKGSAVGYRGLHRWVQKHLGKATVCERCGKKGEGRAIYWANKSRKYKRNFQDWISLCAKCHKHYDAKAKTKSHSN